MSATASKPKAAKKADTPAFGGTISIPARCKPSRALGTDVTRSVLTHAYLRRRQGALWLCATDSYIAVALKVEGDAQEGYIPASALKQMERGKHGEQISETAWRIQTEPYATTTFDVTDQLAGSKGYPNFDDLHVWDDVTYVWNGDPVSVGINPDLMKRIGDSFGTGDHIGCRFDVPGPLKPIRVTPLRSSIEGVALQMPVRLNV